MRSKPPSAPAARARNYRARDTKLGRDVALKILSDSFVTDPDRLARFTREAQVLASLNHPNIAAIHGFEDSGQTHALVDASVLHVVELGAGVHATAGRLSRLAASIYARVP